MIQVDSRPPSEHGHRQKEALPIITSKGAHKQYGSKGLLWQDHTGSQEAAD